MKQQRIDMPQPFYKSTLTLAKIEQNDQRNPIVIMDAGIATEENINWLRSRGHLYIVVSRNRHKLRIGMHTVKIGILMVAMGTKQNL
ncbi:MAG: hypothetical protein P8077_10090 [Gammaproteobacteria bacterium]